MNTQLSENVKIIKVYNYLVTTNEFIGESDAYTPLGTGLPANSTTLVPPKLNSDQVAVFIGDKWSILTDLRGKIAYSTTNQQPTQIMELGELAEGFTFTAPTSPFDEWNGKKWVKSKEKEKQHAIDEAQSQKSSQMADSNEAISMLNDAIELDIATDEEKELLRKWKTYRVLLSRIDPTQAPDIDWPVAP